MRGWASGYESGTYRSGEAPGRTTGRGRKPRNDPRPAAAGRPAQDPARSDLASESLAPHRSADPGRIDLSPLQAGRRADVRRAARGPAEGGHAADAAAADAVRESRSRRAA